MIDAVAPERTDALVALGTCRVDVDDGLIPSTDEVMFAVDAPTSTTKMTLFAPLSSFSVRFRSRKYSATISGSGMIVTFGNAASTASL
jgi:hypothetical protein